MMSLPEYIDRKRQLEVEIAYAVETRIAKFEQETGTEVATALVERISGSLWSSRVEVRL